MLLYVIASAAVLAYIVSMTAAKRVTSCVKAGPDCRPIALEEPRIGERTGPRATCCKDNGVLTCSVHKTTTSSP